eukprot:jgi/Bigna1/65791/fgenesh1_kg.129_\
MEVLSPFATDVEEDHDIKGGEQTIERGQRIRDSRRTTTTSSRTEPTTSSVKAG